MRPIDQTDRDLLMQLKHNARASVSELASTLGLARATVKSRMSALQSDGIIRRFTIDVSEAMDQDAIQAISMLELQLSKVDRVHRELKRMPELTGLYSTNGTWALVAQSETRNLAAFDQFLNRIGRLDGVTNVETCLLLSRLL